MDTPSSAVDSRRHIAALDALRGAAALYVFLHHYGHFVIGPVHPGARRFFFLGQVAVMVFFALSGFVIHHSSLNRVRGGSLGNYAMRRILRVYPIFLAALALTWLANCLAAGELVGVQPAALLGNVLMVQDEGPWPGNWVLPFGGNRPLWSLSYEAWFYVFGYAVALMRLARSRRWAALVVSLAGFGSYVLMPNPVSMFASYFVLWWAGAELSREVLATGRISLRGQAGSLAGVAILAGLWAGMAWHSGSDMYGYPMLQARHCMTLLLVVLVAIAWVRIGGWGFNLLLGWAAPLAGISFGLYVVHYPVLLVAIALRPTGSVWLDLVWVVPVTLALAWLLEQGGLAVTNWVRGTRFVATRLV